MISSETRPMARPKRRTHKEAVRLLAAYYRENPHRFARDFLHIENLRIFQDVMLNEMNHSTQFGCIASRGIGKTFVIAIYCCTRCVLYPGTKICICSGTRSQASLVLEKIKTEILPNSPELAAELEGEIKITAQSAEAYFKNGSYIKVVTAKDTARGNRANLLILDEFRMIDKTTIVTVLDKFLTTARQPGYLKKKKYKNKKEYQEHNMQVYLTSAYYQDHWSYRKAMELARNMLNDRLAWRLLDFTYQLPYSEGLYSEETLVDQMLEEDFSEIKWSMEMCGKWYGSGEDSFFKFEDISRNRKIEAVMMPDELTAALPNGCELRIPPKKNGEVRILSVDVAVMASTRHRNDATAICINQCIPNKVGRFMNNFVYFKTVEGWHTADQALLVRRLFDEYQCDYIAIDVKGVGFGVADTLIREIADTDVGVIYPALSCCNNPDWAARCRVPNARKAIWAINATPEKNGQYASMLREGFRTGRIRLPVTEYDGEKYIERIKGAKSLSTAQKTELLMPYIETTLAIDELIKLNCDTSGRFLKIKERSTARKDRYSAMCYSYAVSCEIERRRGGRRASAAPKEEFLFRAPKIM